MEIDEITKKLCEHQIDIAKGEMFEMIFKKLDEYKKQIEEKQAIIDRLVAGEK